LPAPGLGPTGPAHLSGPRLRLHGWIKNIRRRWERASTVHSQYGWTVEIQCSEEHGPWDHHKAS
jgi:hypothetical protein